jgi:hypothetical protein
VLVPAWSPKPSTSALSASIPAPALPAVETTSARREPASGDEDVPMPAWSRPSAPPALPAAYVGTPSARDRNRREQGESAAPIVRVHIGRIDVHATVAAPVSTPRNAVAAPTGARPMSLETYMRRRGRGGAGR